MKVSRSVFSSNGLPSKRTVVTAWLCSILFRSCRAALKRMMTRDTFNIYMLLLTLSVLLLSLDGFDLVTTFTSVATCLNNVGPGLEMVGPMGSFAKWFQEYSR